MRTQSGQRGGRRRVALLAIVLAAVTAGSAAPVRAVPSPGGAAGTIRTMAGVTRDFQSGGYGPEDVVATESQFHNPRGLAFAPNGDVYVSDALNHRVRRIDASGVVHLVAGSGAPGELNEPHGVAVDSRGNVYIADSRNCVIRKVDTAGVMTTVAGTGQKAPTTDACVKTSETSVSGDPLAIGLDQPRSLFLSRVNGVDTLWIADMGNNMIRAIDVGSAVPTLTRVAGRKASRHYGAGGAGKDALEADLRHPEGVWVADDGTVYFTDGGNNLVRKIAPAAPGAIRRISTIAGDVAAAEANAFGADDLVGSSDGDGGDAVDASLDRPRGITGDNRGNLYVAEQHGSRIRRINLGSGTITTVAGDGTFLEQRTNGGSATIQGENGPALETQFAMPRDIQINPSDGSLWIADSRNNRIRAVSDVADAPGRKIPTGGGTPGPVRPPAPSSVTAVPGNGSATVTWTAPADDGGSPITSYTVTSSAGQTAVVDGAALSATMTGLSNGTAHTFTVRATSSVGNGAPSAPSDPVVPSAPPGPADTPAGPAVPPPPAPASGGVPAGRAGYWMVGADGVVYPFGAAKPLGNAPTAAAVDLEPTPSGNGYWIVDEQGSVFAFGDAVGRGNADRTKLAAGEKVTSLSATGDGGGYWIFTSRGRVLTFGNAAHLGDVSGLTLAGPVLDSIVTPSGSGYYMVASDGGIFAFGDATFYGSMGGHRLNAAVQSLVPDSDGAGYWLVASDGGIFAFAADFKGSMGGTKLNKPVTGMVRAGGGYLMVGEDGGIFDFSGDPNSFKGSLGANPPARPITSVAVLAR